MTKNISERIFIGSILLLSVIIILLLLFTLSFPISNSEQYELLLKAPILLIIICYIFVGLLIGTHYYLYKNWLVLGTKNVLFRLFLNPYSYFMIVLWKPVGTGILENLFKGYYLFIRILFIDSIIIIIIITLFFVFGKYFSKKWLENNERITYS